ncbi:MAG: beta-hexosaminidase, partial [Rhodobacteraceae bacterium]|nr:beta-hexosaminidase [Paracoccaceae bacterium]
LGMTAHVRYTALDATAPATQSTTVIGDVIRGRIGFDGLLMTDDLSMKALRGPFGVRAEAAIGAGCDLVLHCNGNPAEAAAVAEVVPELAGRALARAERAQAVRGSAGQADPAALEAEFVELRERATGA